METRLFVNQLVSADEFYKRPKKPSPSVHSGDSRKCSFSRRQSRTITFRFVSYRLQSHQPESPEGHLPTTRDEGRFGTYNLFPAIRRTRPAVTKKRQAKNSPLAKKTLGVGHSLSGCRDVRNGLFLDLETLVKGRSRRSLEETVLDSSRQRKDRPNTPHGILTQLPRRSR